MFRMGGGVFPSRQVRVTDLRSARRVLHCVRQRERTILTSVSAGGEQDGESFPGSLPSSLPVTVVCSSRTTEPVASLSEDQISLSRRWRKVSAQTEVGRCLPRCQGVGTKVLTAPKKSVCSWPCTFLRFNRCALTFSPLPPPPFPLSLRPPLPTYVGTLPRR